MDKEDKQLEGLRKRFINTKVLLIIALVVVVIGAGSGIYLMKASDNPEFCSSCHLMQSYYDSYNDSELLAHKHAQADLVCHDCHESSIAIQAEEGFKYITGDYQVPLEKREFSMDFCLECHDDFDTAVKAATIFEDSNPHDSHNGEIECNTCHSMHRQSEPLCSQCHIFDWIDELDEGWVKL